MQMAAVGYGSLGLLGLTGCGGDDDDGGDGTYSGQFAVNNLNAVVSGAVPYYCQETGLFERNDLDLELIDAEGGSTAIRLIQSNTKIGFSAAVAACSARESVRDLKIIGGILNAATTSWVAPKDSSISVDNLRGKKIGSSSPDSVTTYFADLLIDRQGLSREDVDVVYVGGAPDAWTAVQNGVVDLAWSALPYARVLVEDKGAKTVFDNSRLLPAWTDNVVVALGSFLESEAETVNRLMATLNQGIKEMRDDPERAGSIWGKAISIPEATATSVLRDQRENISLRIDKQGIAAAARAAVELGAIKQAPSVDDLIDDRFQPSGVV